MVNASPTVLRLGIQLIWTSDVQQALSSKDSATKIATEDHEYDANVGYFGCPILWKYTHTHTDRYIYILYRDIHTHIYIYNTFICINYIRIYIYSKIVSLYCIVMGLWPSTRSLSWLQHVPTPLALGWVCQWYGRMKIVWLRWWLGYT